jgi:hypothetical protein
MNFGRLNRGDHQMNANWLVIVALIVSCPAFGADRKLLDCNLQGDPVVDHVTVYSTANGRVLEELVHGFFHRRILDPSEWSSRNIWLKAEWGGTHALYFQNDSWWYRTESPEIGCFGEADCQIRP